MTASKEREAQRFKQAIDAVKSFHGTVTGHPLLASNSNLTACEPRCPRRGRTFMAGSKAPFKSRPTGNRCSCSASLMTSWASLTRKISDQTAALAVHRKALAVRRALAFEPEAGAGDQARTGSQPDRRRLVRAIDRRHEAAAGACGEEARSLAKEIGTHPANVDATSRRPDHGLSIDRSRPARHRRPGGGLTAYRDVVAIRQKLADGQPGAIHRPDRIGG